MEAPSGDAAACCRCGWLWRRRTTTRRCGSTGTCSGGGGAPGARRRGGEGHHPGCRPGNARDLEPAQVDMIDRVEVGRRVSPHLRVAFEVVDAEAVTSQLVGAGAELFAPPTVTRWDSLNSRALAPGGLSSPCSRSWSSPARPPRACPSSTMAALPRQQLEALPSVRAVRSGCVDSERARAPEVGQLTRLPPSRPSTRRSRRRAGRVVGLAAGDDPQLVVVGGAAARSGPRRRGGGRGAGR